MIELQLKKFCAHAVTEGVVSNTDGGLLGFKEAAAEYVDE